MARLLTTSALLPWYNYANCYNEHCPVLGSMLSHCMQKQLFLSKYRKWQHEWQNMSHQHVLPWQPTSATTHLITTVSLFYIFDITVSVHNTQLGQNVNSPNFRYIGAGTLPTFPCGNIKINCYKRCRLRPIFKLSASRWCVGTAQWGTLPKPCNSMTCWWCYGQLFGYA